MEDKSNDKKISIIPLFSTPAIITNIGRDFTEDELQFFLHDIPMYKDKKVEMTNHRSKDFYLFDNYSELLLRTICASGVFRTHPNLYKLTKDD